MTYDGSTGLVVLFGGIGNGGTSGGTWIYGAPSAPVITSGGTATFTQGSPGTFTVTATGNPAPTYSESGALPAGLSFSSSGALSGTPSGVSGAFDLIITAVNSAGVATQNLVLVVDEAPVITSLHSATFVTGFKGKFQVTAVGYPAPTFTEKGTLPAGLTLSSTGLLSGAPAVGTQGSYPIVITATNSGGTGQQNFTLTVDQ
jgi:Putative Ig domain